MQEIKLTRENIMHLGNAFKENLYIIYERNPDCQDINGIDMILKIPDATYQIHLEQIE